MYTLFIDTHSGLITVALYDGKNIIEKIQESEYSHAKYLASMISDILNENNLSVKDIKDIVAINGPGSFTGLRIGLSAAKTLAYTLKIPIYLVSSLSSYLVSDNSSCDKLCVIEDNKGYYVSVFDKENKVLREEEYVTELKGLNEIYRVKESLDVKKVIQFALESKSVDAHLVRANYVKRIEVEK